MMQFRTVCLRLLLGLSLLSPLSPVDNPQIRNLPHIISLLQTWFGGDQFAIAFNIPAKYCDPKFIPYQNFFPGKQDIIDAMNGESRLFVGKEFIGAKPKPIGKLKSNYHSEYLLLVRSNPPQESPNDPLIRQLLNIRQDGCAVFYTYNSPCVKSCSTPGRQYSIIPALDHFTRHSGPKAFVFTQIWKYDNGSTLWSDNIKEINARVPLYRCSGERCIPCVNIEGVAKECLVN